MCASDPKRGYQGLDIESPRDHKLSSKSLRCRATFMAEAIERRSTIAVWIDPANDNQRS